MLSVSFVHIFGSGRKSITLLNRAKQTHKGDISGNRYQFSFKNELSIFCSKLDNLQIEGIKQFLQEKKTFRRYHGFKVSLVKCLASAPEGFFSMAVSTSNK